MHDSRIRGLFVSMSASMLGRLPSFCLGPDCLEVLSRPMEISYAWVGGRAACIIQRSKDTSTGKRASTRSVCVVGDLRVDGTRLIEPLLLPRGQAGRVR